VLYADDRNALALAVVCGDQGQPVAHSTSRYSDSSRASSFVRPGDILGRGRCDGVI
jgi:hypothetical protein